MADSTVLKPIVLNLKDRGLSAIDYIDYFDEGRYGADRPYFVGRYTDLESIAKQMNKCLALQSTPGSFIHLNRLEVPDKWIEPLQDPNELYPQRAQYAIRFMLRIKFYGDFGYLDLGARWNEKYTAAAEANNLIIKPEDLEVINTCWLSIADANAIKEMLLSSKEGENSIFTYDGETMKYDPETDSVVELSEEEKKANAEKQAEANAVYLTDGDSILGTGTEVIDAA